MDKAGALLQAGQAGEIVIRGPNVTAGYENNPAANAAAFTDGWFRTGDQGHLDSDGYLFITGRLKEIINRGGEKIAPREIDEALLSYPGVRQAVAFAVRHPTLGEDLNAAVVIDGQRVTESDLRHYLAQRLPAFKIPTRIVFLKEIPKGPTGKVQRIGLADRLAQELAVAYEPPADQTETLIVQVFQQVLGREGLGRRDNFFSAGGDSIRAMQAASRLREPLGWKCRWHCSFERPPRRAWRRRCDVCRTSVTWERWRGNWNNCRRKKWSGCWATRRASRTFHSEKSNARRTRCTPGKQEASSEQSHEINRCLKRVGGPVQGQDAPASARHGRGPAVHRDLRCV